MNTLFYNVTAITMDENNPKLENGYLAVSGDKISYLGQTRPEGKFDREIDCAGKVMMPGLINAHTHLPMTLMRGYGGGCDLQTWLGEYIFPAEARLDSRSVRAGTALALCELMANGVTCVADMYYFCEDIAEMVEQSGLSININRSMVTFGAVERPQELTCWREMETLYQNWHGKNDGQILVDGGFHAEYTSSVNPHLWGEGAKWANERGVRMQIHLSETKREHKDAIARHGMTPTATFAHYGLLDAPTVCAHGVYLTEDDMKILAEKGATVVHNPVSNLKLASGVAPVPKMLELGVNVALGTDGVSSNNNHDLFEEIKLAAMLHGGISGDPTAITAHQALQMATVNGAKALGRETGVLAEGKIADVILLDFQKPGLTPCHDIEENLVFSARGSDVCLTMARGQVVYENGVFHTMNLDEIQKEMAEYAMPLIFG